MEAEGLMGRGGGICTYVCAAQSLYDIVNSGARHGCIIGVHKAPLTVPFAGRAFG